MSSWAPGTNVDDRGHGGSRNGTAITGLWIHHTTSTDAREYVAGSNDRDSHPTYHVATDGRITGIVHPDRRPFSTLNNDGESEDYYAVTIECDNIKIGGDWEVSEASMASIVVIARHHAAESARAGHPIEVNVVGETQAGFWVGWHAQVMSTACCGPFLIAHIPAIVDAANNGTIITSGPYDDINNGYSTREIQTLLNALGYGLIVDGEYGDKTTAAVADFQSKHGLTQDGDVGDLTMPVLRGVVAGLGTPPVTDPPVTTPTVTEPPVTTPPVVDPPVVVPPKEPVTNIDLEKLDDTAVVIAEQASVWLPTATRKKIYQVVSVVGAALTSVGIVGVSISGLIGGTVGAQVALISGIVSTVAGAAGAAAAKLADKNTNG